MLLRSSGRRALRFPIAFVSFFFALFIGFASAHEGHDHGDAKPPAVSSTWPRVTITSDLYEIVGVLRDGRLTIYLDSFATNEPVEDAKIEVTIGDAPGAEAKPEGPGRFSIAAITSGATEVIFAVTSPKGDDLLIGQLELPKSAMTQSPQSFFAKARLNTFNRPVAIGAIIALLLFIIVLAALYGRPLRHAVWITGLLISAAFANEAWSHEGHDHAKDEHASAAESSGALLSDAPRRLPDGTVFVAKPTQRLLEVRTNPLVVTTGYPTVSLIGRVVANPNRSGLVQSLNGGRIIASDAEIPTVGQRVRKGDVLAMVEPIVPQADRTTISDKLGEIEQLIASAEARLRRLRLLLEKNAAPQSQVVDADIELEGLKRRREVTRQMRTEAEALRAPIDGVIATARAVTGQVVQTQDVVFQIVDPNSFWVETLVYGDTKPETLAAATVTVGQETMRLNFRGFSRALQRQATLVQFTIETPPRSLNIGQPVTVIARTGGSLSGLIVPRAAVVRTQNGESIVWSHVDPERFAPRPVRIQALDGISVIILAGVDAGERIVTRGADLINQVR